MIAVRNKDSAYRESADTVLQVSITTNREIHERLKERKNKYEEKVSDLFIVRADSIDASPNPASLLRSGRKRVV